MAVSKINRKIKDKQAVSYPSHVIEGVKKSLKQADNGQLTPYTGIKNMLSL
jgi:hypothetical protein